MTVNEINLYRVENFPYNILLKYDVVKKPKYARGKRFEKSYIDVVCAFDIESTNLKTYYYTKSNNRPKNKYLGNMHASWEQFTPMNRHENKQSVMYIWQFDIYTPDCIHWTIIGRTWNEYKTFITRIKQTIHNNCLAVYVHNLSYEFEFLQGVFDFESENIFATGARKVLNIRTDTIEYRCSYLLSNMSLQNFTRQMKVQHQKLSGDEFDYSVKRYYFTDIEPEKLEYCINDVAGLTEAVKNKMQMFNDTLYTIPMTATGYPRRDINNVLRNQCNYFWLKSLQPNLEVYTILRKAFRGGNTHANRYYVGGENGQIYDNEDVYTYDMASAYPAALLNGEYPITPFKRVIDPTFDKMITLIHQKHMACLIHLKIDNVKLREKWWGCPYLSKDKCKYKNAVFDNGRILNAEKIEMWITDIDFSIICEEYQFDYIYIYELYCSKYGPLPEPIKDVVRYYYTQKTQLKGVEGILENGVDAETLYQVFKAMLNSLYGMAAQDPVIDENVFDTITISEVDENGELTEQNIKINGRILKGFVNPVEQIVYPKNATMQERYKILSQKREQYIRDCIEKLQNSARFPYQWGVWTTAHCRRQLENGMRHIWKFYDPLKCYFVYTDTDSIKYSDPEKRVDWADFNAEIESISRKNNAVARNDKTGIEYPIGIFELDKHIAKRFRTMGAKRYVYTDENDKLHVTIAGVNKIKAVPELEKMGGISAFNDGIVFHSAGGVQVTYNDCGDYGRFIYNTKTQKLEFMEITSNVYIEDNTKTITRTYEYRELIDECYNDMNFAVKTLKNMFKRVDIYDNL